MIGSISRVFAVSVVGLGMLHFSPPAAATHDSGAIIRTWNEVALQTVRVKNQSDAQAARAYAMVHVAMYDAVNGIDSKNGFIDRKHALVPPSGAPVNGHPVAAAAAAAHAVLTGLFPDQAAVYNAQLAADLAPLSPPSNVLAGKAWGAAVGADVLVARAADGSSPDETQPAGSGAGKFRAAWCCVQFRNLAPFAIVNSSVYNGSGPPALTSVDYAAEFAEVAVIGNAALVDSAKKATYDYWALGGGTSQPAGWWLQATREASIGKNLSLERTARLFALVSMGLADSVAPTYWTKWNFQFWRPTTAIREADSDGNPATIQDATWAARANTVGGSPEYWSGHSSFSAVAATILAGFFCDDAISTTLASDSKPLDVRTFASFSAAAAEAGRSRVLGGIHFEQDGNQDGLKAGRAIGAEILKNSLLLKLPITHFGACLL
jgi:hypothetical protein